MGSCVSSNADAVPQGERLRTLQMPIQPSIPPSIPASIPAPVPLVEPSVSEICRPRSRQGSIKSLRSARSAGRSPQVESSYTPRYRVKSAPQKVPAMKGKEDAPPLPHPAGQTSWNPNSDHRQTGTEYSRESPRRPTLIYPARRPLDSTVRQVLPKDFRFRILVVGKSCSGKSSLIKTVFKVDMAGAPEKVNINAEFRPADNRHLIVHEFSDLNSKTTRDFISHRTDQGCLPPGKLHAIWVCVPASDAIASGLGDGVKEILALRNSANVPVVLVLTKFDMAVSQVLRDSFSGKLQHYERARESAHKKCKELCSNIIIQEGQRARRLRDVPAEIVSKEENFGDLIQNLVVTTDKLITGLSESPRSNWGVRVKNWARQRLGTVALAWSATIRVGRDIINQASIAVGQSRYWRGLWSGLHFAGQSLKSCVNIIHDDIVKIWNMNDKTGYLLSDIFKAKMTRLVKGLAGSSRAPLTSDWGSAAGDYADWVHDTFSKDSPENVRCVASYIVNLTAIMDGIFGVAAGGMTPQHALQILDRHERSGRRDEIHQSFNAEAFSVQEDDSVLEKIFDLIKQYCALTSVTGGSG